MQNIYANKAVEIIENHNSSVPFFMYAPLQSTHDPLQAPKVSERSERSELSELSQFAFFWLKRQIFEWSE